MSLEDRFRELEPRERLILGALLGVVVLFILVIIPATLYQRLSTQEEQNERLRDSIELLERATPAIQRTDAELDVIRSRYRRPAPPLAGLLSQLATKNSVSIPQSQDLAALPHGSNYDERRTKIVLRSVGLLALGRFMEAIENSPYPISIGRLDIHKLGNKPDNYNVEMVVSAFDRTVDDGAGSDSGSGSDKP